MCQLLQHGGPDDEGLFVEESRGLVLGNRRLALLDLSPAGHMPMTYGERYTVTYNGELYNYAILKTELQSLGHVFNNHTDTEVILAAFAQWKVQAFARFKGMYAFALWDKLEGCLYLVRDAAGIKPLYYSHKNDVLVFASEMRAFASSGQTYISDVNWPVMLMAYGHLPEPVATLNGVKPLPKGCFARVDCNTGRMQLQSFRHYSFSERITEGGAVAVKEQLQKAVQQQMLADAPVGVFLSGGLDSAIIASLAAKHNTGTLKTLSIYFNDAAFSEKPYQDLVIQQLQCAHAQWLLTPKDFAAGFPKVLQAMDLPSCDGINTWFISKYAKEQGLKAVLSGIGGDELFGGYPSFKRMQLARLIQQAPDMAVRQGVHFNSRKFNRLSYLQLPGIKGIYLFLRGHFTPGEIARQLDMDEQHVWRVLNETPLYMDLPDLADGNKASWMEFNLYMQNQLLRDADVMSMQHGVEIRVPFLDEDLVSTAMAMAPPNKYPVGLPKQLLINCFKDILPAPVWDRPKMGFSFPFDDWFRQNELVMDFLAAPANAATLKLFNSGQVKWYQVMLLLLLKQPSLQAA